MRSSIAGLALLASSLAGCVAPGPYYGDAYPSSGPYYGPRGAYYDPYPAYYGPDVYYYSYSPGPGYAYRPGYGYYYRQPTYQGRPPDRHEHGRNDDYGHRPPQGRPDRPDGSDRPDRPDRPNRPDRPSQGGVGSVITGAVRGAQPPERPRAPSTSAGRPSRDRPEQRPAPVQAQPPASVGEGRNSSGRGGWGRIVTDR